MQTGPMSSRARYKLFCPVIREKLIKEWALLHELECPHRRDASDAEIKKLKHG